MHFKSFAAAAITAFALFGSAVSAPIEPQTLEARATLATRALTGLTFTFSGDLANIAIPPILTSGSAKDIAKSKKKNTAAVAKQKAREKLQQTAQAHAVALLNAAESKLKLPNGMHIQAVNDFHSSKDPERHVTIQFTAPICAGTCVGHAYETLGHGKIFDAHHATIFSAP